MTEKSESGLISFFKERAEQQWDDNEQPYLLAAAPSHLRHVGVNYKEVLGEEKLKAFIKRTQGPDTFRLVEHPNQKPKVGVVPSTAEFSFAPTEPTAGPGDHPTNKVDSEEVVMNFLRALGNLRDADLDGFTIPAKTLAKLVRKR